MYPGTAFQGTRYDFISRYNRVLSATDTTACMFEGYV
jgi:hypothetical protein